MRLPLRTQILGVGAVVALIVGVAFAGLLFAIGDLRSSARVAQHSDDVVATSNGLEKLVLDLETGARGYVITNDPSFLEPWRAARVAVPGQIGKLETLVQDEPVQEDRAQELGRQLTAYVNEFSIPLVGSTDTDAARVGSIISTAEGKRRVDSLRTLFDTFDRTASRRASDSRTAADSGAQRAIVIGIAGLLAMVALIGLFAFYLAQAIGVPVRRLAVAARSRRSGNLRVQVPNGGPGEIGALVSDFNAMGVVLDESREELEGQNAELEAQQSELEAQHSELEEALAELSSEKERIGAYYGFGRRLIAEVEVHAVVTAALEEVCDFARADVGTVYAVEEPGSEMFVLAGTRALDPTHQPQLLGEHGVAGRSAAQKRTLSVSYGTTSLKLEAFGQEVAISHELHVPLCSAGGTLGVLTMGRAADMPFRPDEVEGIEHLAAQAAMALAQALSFADAKRQAAINGAILNATTDGILLVDPSGRFVFANEAARRFVDAHDLSLDQPFDEVTDQIAKQVTDPDAYRLACADRRSTPGLQAVVEYEIAASNRSFRNYMAPVTDEDGTLLGRIVISRETTAERLAERTKTELLATVSHELRTPLTGVLGFAELLLRQDPGEETRKQYLTTIHREARRLTALINDFLDLQKIEEGRFALVLDPVDLTGVLERPVELFAAQSDKHLITLTLPEAPVVVLGEGSRLEQVVANLVSNAIKYSPHGGEIKIVAESREGFARVSITDPGLGIPAPQQEKIFQKFFRVDSSTTREIGGTGLGLALCREIVEAHGGRIGFDSVEGQGSTFWFEIPSGRRTGRGDSGRVLVVEDDPATAALMAEHLGLDGFEVETAPTGERALELALASPPTLICLDILLPGKLDGWEVMERLRENPATAEVPVVVCTANNGRNRAAALGASDFLTKPFTGDLLRSAIERVLPDKHGSLLVVDDEEAVRRLVIDTLGNGYAFREAADGEEALAAIKQERPSGVVLDLMLPKLDGFTVLKRLQADRSTRSIPVLVLTGSSLSEHERQRLSSGAISVLSKSEYSGRELRGLVERALGRRNQG